MIGLERIGFQSFAMRTIDYIAFALFILQYIGYQFVYLRLAGKEGWQTREMVIQEHRLRWLKIIVDSDQPILAIQTIRNLTMTNTFMISLAMILMGGIISVFSANLNWLATLESGEYMEFLSGHPAAIKLLVALVMLLIATSNFTFGLRILYNMNFTMAASVAAPRLVFHEEQLARSSRHFISGVRALYHFIAPMIGILDPYAMIAFTFLTTYLFFHFDFEKSSRV